MTLGFVIGESKPTIVTGQTSRSLPIGEYVIINSKLSLIHISEPTRQAEIS